MKLKTYICFILVYSVMGVSVTASAHDRELVISAINNEYYTDDAERAVSAIQQVDPSLDDDAYLKAVFSCLDRYSEYYTKEECEALTVSNQQNMISASLLGDVIEVKITHFGKGIETIFDQYMEKCEKQQVRELVLDLTECPGGYVSVMNRIAQRILPEGKIVTAKFKDREESYYSDLEVCPFEKITVKISSHTASAAEILAAALRESGAATVVGVQSYGKTSVQSMYYLQSGAAFKITCGQYFTRDGNDITNIGVTPDVVDYRFPVLIKWNKNCIFR